MSNSIVDKFIETRVAILNMGEDGILRIVLNHENGIYPDDMKELSGAIAQISGREEVPVLMKSVNYKLPSREIRSTPVTGGKIKAIAFLVTNPLAKVGVNFFIKLNAPPFPFKMFTDEKEALLWLKSFQV